MSRQLAKGLALFIFCLLVDQLTKVWGTTASTYAENPGFIFGMAQDLPASLRVIALSSVFGFLFFLYLLLLYFLPLQLLKLKLGLSFLAGGIFGNVVDRVWLGTSVDFIPFPLGDSVMTFNMADVFQWVGAALILYNVVIHEKIIWYPENQRGRYLVHPKEQFRFAFKMTLTALCCSLLLGIFATTYLRNTLLSLNYQSSSTLTLFLIAYLCLTLLFSLFVFLAGIVISHRTAGPFYAFELYVEDLLNGSERVFYLREGDHYKHLQNIAEQLRVSLKKKKDK